MGGLLVVNADSPNALAIGKQFSDRRNALRRVARGPGDACPSTSASRSRARTSNCGRPSASNTCFTPVLGRPIIQPGRSLHGRHWPSVPILT